MIGEGEFQPGIVDPTRGKSLGRRAGASEERLEKLSGPPGPRDDVVGR
jgi:hypothetical protein